MSGLSIRKMIDIFLEIFASLKGSNKNMKKRVRRV
jgi:hypothetical protein